MRVIADEDDLVGHQSARSIHIAILWPRVAREVADLPNDNSSSRSSEFRHHVNGQVYAVERSLGRISNNNGSMLYKVS